MLRSVNTYPIWDSSLKRSGWRSFHPFQKSRRNHRSHVWTEAVLGMVFVPMQKLSGIAWTPIRYVTLHFTDQIGAASLRHRNSRQNHCSHVWTEALLGMVFVPMQKLCCIVWTTSIRFVTHDRRAASLRYRNRAEITVPIFEQKPFSVWFPCRRKNFPV